MLSVLPAMVTSLVPVGKDTVEMDLYALVSVPPHINLLGGSVQNRNSSRIQNPKFKTKVIFQWRFPSTAEWRNLGLTGRMRDEESILKH